MTEDPLMEREPPLRLLVGLAMRRPPEDPRAAVEALESAVEEVVLPATFVDFDWRTTVITPADDLEGDTSGLTTSTRQWARLRDAASVLESGGVGALRRDVPNGAVPPDPTANPVNANVSLLPDRPATLTWSVHRWAVRDWPEFFGAAKRWLLEAAQRLGADSGFITYDVHDAVDPSSVWEVVTGVAPGHRDFARKVWGYGWGTLLSRPLAESVGGVAAMKGLPGAGLLVGPGGQVWVQLGDDPAAVDRAAVAALRAVLTPVLPVGTRTVEEYDEPPASPYEVRPRYVV
jgi:hypothetical protein